MRPARFVVLLSVLILLTAPCMAAPHGHSSASKHAASQPAAQTAPLTPLTTPWLQGVTTTSVYVLFEAQDKIPAASVDYGPTDSYDE